MFPRSRREYIFYSVSDIKDSKLKFIIKILKSVIKFHVVGSDTLILTPVVTIISREVAVLLT